MDYLQRRKLAKIKMGATERLVEQVLSDHPEYRNLGHDKNGCHYINKLIRYIWKFHGDLNARSIIRFYTEAMKRHPEWDTEHNIENRANAETAFHERFRPNNGDGFTRTADIMPTPPIKAEPKQAILFHTPQSHD